MITFFMPLILLAGVGDDPPGKRQAAERQTVSAQLESWQREHDKVKQEFFTGLGQVQKKEERDRLLKEKQPKVDEYAERCFLLVQEYPENPTAYHALFWLGSEPAQENYWPRIIEVLMKKCETGTLKELRQIFLAKYLIRQLTPIGPVLVAKLQTQGNQPEAEVLLDWVARLMKEQGGLEGDKTFRQAIELLVERFPKSRRLEQHCLSLAHHEDHQWALTQVRVLIDRNFAGNLALMSEYALGVIQSHSETNVQEVLRRFDLFIRNAQTIKEKHFTEALNDAIERANGLRWVGKPAREMAGEDLQGKPARLSDYRGKVVLVSFWGFWCPNCVKMLPVEKALVKRYEGKPFVLLGVNSDQDQEELQKQIGIQGVNWRSVKNRQGERMIAQDWSVKVWPTMFLVDHKGVIRMRWVGNPGEGNVTASIDKWLVEAAQAK